MSGVEAVCLNNLDTLVATEPVKIHSLKNSKTFSNVYLNVSLNTKVGRGD